MNHPKLWWVMCLCDVQRVAFFWYVCREDWERGVAEMRGMGELFPVDV